MSTASEKLVAATSIAKALNLRDTLQSLARSLSDKCFVTTSIASRGISLMLNILATPAVKA